MDMLLDHCGLFAPRIDDLMLWSSPRRFAQQGIMLHLSLKAKSRLAGANLRQQTALSKRF